MEPRPHLRLIQHPHSAPYICNHTIVYTLWWIKSNSNLNSTHAKVLCGLDYALFHHLNRDQRMKKSGDLGVNRKKLCDCKVRSNIISPGAWTASKSTSVMSLAVPTSSAGTGPSVRSVVKWDISTFLENVVKIMPMYIFSHEKFTQFCIDTPFTWVRMPSREYGKDWCSGNSAFKISTGWKGTQCHA